MSKAVVVLAAAVISFSALATPASARTPHVWGGWVIGIANGWGPLYGPRDLYAPDALWDAQLRAAAITSARRGLPH